VVQALSRRGAGATVVSLGGLALAKQCGVDRTKMIFDGPSKSREELAGAIAEGVGMINVESIQEVADIESLCQELGVEQARVGVRVNFAMDAETHPGLATGTREGKFGIPEDEVVRFFRGGVRKLKRVKVRGLHSHVGSQITDMRVFRALTRKLVDIADELGHKGDHWIDEFNFGGGLGVDYGHGGTSGFASYADATAGAFARLRARSSGRTPRLVFELGRSIVADSTVLLSRVNYVKKAGKTEWALLDAGMNDFIRPALYGAYHSIVPAATKLRSRSTAAYSFGGPVCESTDTFGAGRRLGVRLTKGDTVAILDAGAYGISMASHYNMREIPAVAATSRGKHWLAQPRG
jgi:diaminopimelate decarboxylase